MAFVRVRAARGHAAPNSLIAAHELACPAMLRKLKPKLQFSSKNGCPNMQLLELSNFRSEQQSNDYISSLCKQQRFRQALEAFHLLVQNSNFKINLSTYAHLFSACSSLRSLENGKKVHNHLQITFCQPDVVLQNHILNIYGKCGSLRDAQMVFDVMPERNALSWTSLIAGYSQNQQEKTAMTLYFDMLCSGFMPDNYTLGSVIKACTSTGDINLGRQLHTQLVKSTSDSCLIAHNALISMCTKFQQIVDASTIFSRISLSFYSKMRYVGLFPDEITIGSLLCACTTSSVLHTGERLHCYIVKMGNLLKTCAQLTSLDIGKQVHSYALKVGLEYDNSVANGLLDLYTKCGVLGGARTLFECMEGTDVVPWSTLIVGCAQSGHGQEALSLFERMIDLGVNPNEITFIGVLSACSHIGLVEEGWQFYKTMEARYGVVPTREHCSCLVDMLARAGHLIEAKDFIKQLTFEPDIVAWKTLLSACKTYGNVCIGKWAAENVLKTDPSNSSAYVLLCNIYANERRVVASGKSLVKVEVQNKFHTFSVKDVKHAEATEIYFTLENLYLQMLDVGYLQEKGSSFKDFPTELEEAS
ncbi:hypothetical protein Cgig2_007559 [Carnegiea gigantea]|uniref:Pentatricopeptide repeat-containing protein n=1 Tax=Carnegiea gigantea TaxID=171969 RepID=A0A9Q1GMN0_9CARY|nr:hypothetical protein Cgig2_007559 [Carnegiea gigantea]